MRRIWAWALGSWATLSLWSAPAEAYVLDFERYFVCRPDDGRAVATPATRPRGPRDARVPVKKRRGPSVLNGAPLVTVDVSVAQALPTRRTDAPKAGPVPLPVVMREARNDFRCIGWERGAAGVLRVVAAPPGARFLHHQNAASYRSTNIVFAGTFGIQQARAPLERILARPLAPGLERWQQSEELHVRRDAAVALADLGHQKAAPRVLAHVELLEQVDDFNYYREAIDALDRLAPALADRHALEVLEQEEKQPSKRFEFLLATLLPYVRTVSPRSLSLLQRLGETLGTSHLGCRVGAARIVHGDTVLADTVRPHVEQDIRHNFVANCYSELVEVLAPGRDPDELDVILWRQRWRAMVALLGSMQAAEHAGKPDPRFAPARRKLLAWLLAHKTQHLYDPKADNAKSWSHVREWDALYTVARAALGDGAAISSLVALIGDGQNEGTAPAIAARHGLALEIPGVDKALDGLLRTMVTREPVRHDRDSWPKRGHLTLTEEGQVVEALAARGDERFVLGLLAHHGYVREVAAFHLARRRPASACRRVAAAAQNASEDAIQFAFWALTVLGKRCEAAMQTLATDASQPPDVRGMATEVLAMLRNPTALSLARASAPHRSMAPALARAELIFHSPE